MPGPARFQRPGDPANNGFRDVGHKLARPVDAFARWLHRVGNVGAVHYASAVEAALGTQHATSFVVNVYSSHTDFGGSWRLRPSRQQAPSSTLSKRFA
jgi:hypothetical protein